MVKCQSCVSEEEAGMACLSCPCSNTSFPPASKDQNPGAKKDIHLAQQLGRLNLQQLQSLCSLGNLQYQGSKETLIGRLQQVTTSDQGAEVNNNVYVNYFLQQEQQMKKVNTSEQARVQMRTNLLNQVRDIKHRKQNQRQNSSEVVKKVKEHLSKIPGGQNLAEKMDVLKQKLQKSDCDSEKDRQTVMISNAEKVSKKVEERLARMEARLEVEKDNVELKKKANLVRRKLQRCYFLMQLLPLSRNPTDHDAFIRKCKKQRNNERRLQQMQTEKKIGGEITDQLPSSHATDSDYIIMKEDKTFWGSSRKIVLLSNEGLRKFCRWKGGWSNSKEHVEKKSGARLELKAAGELLIVGETIAAHKAMNMIHGYFGNMKHL